MHDGAHKPAREPRQWGPRLKDPFSVVRTPPGNAQAFSAEQDGAAGGRSNRMVHREGRTPVTASIALKHFKKQRRIYAYLRYWTDGGTTSVYVGDATADTRAEALKKGWEVAQRKGLVGRR